MRYIQVGILAALVLVAVLLGLNLMNDRTAPVEEAAIPSATASPMPAEETASPETPAAVSDATLPAESPATVASASPKPAVAPSRPASENTGTSASRSASASIPKPSPTRERPASQPKPSAKPEAAEEIAQTTPHPVRPDTRTLPPPSVPEAPVPSTTERYDIMKPETRVISSANVPAPARTVTIPSGTILTIRTIQTLSSKSNAAGDTFTGTLDQPLVLEDMVIAERGSRVEGKVVEVTESGRIKGLAQMSIALTKINTSDGQSVDVQTQSFLMEAEKTTKSDATKVGIATGIGAALGAIFGGGKGAAIGAAAGGAAGAGTVVATKGKPAEIPSETRINFRLERPLTLTEKINEN